MHDLSSYLPLIQSHMDATITDRKTSKQLFEELQLQLPSGLTQPQFASFLSNAVRDGQIQGFKTKKGPQGGYIRGTKGSEEPASRPKPQPKPLAEEAPPEEATDKEDSEEDSEEEEEAEEDPEDKEASEEEAEAEEEAEEDEDEDESPEEEEEARGVVNLTSTARLYAVDGRNWSYQVKTGQNWVSRYYYPNLKDALRYTAARIVDTELRTRVIRGVKHLEGIELQVVSFLEKLVRSQT
ncbi:MAG: hypothetical protein WC565_05280 [Parcubacteria group bacterium]|jgi:hypothetical protein